MEVDLPQDVIDETVNSILSAANTSRIVVPKRTLAVVLGAIKRRSAQGIWSLNEIDAIKRLDDTLSRS